MVRAFFQLAFAIQAFLDTHGFGTFFDFFDQVFHFVQTSGGISLYCVVELLQAEFHVMEVRDGFAQRTFRNVGQHGLEVAECLACFVRQLRVDLFVALAVRDEQANAPIAVAVEIIQLVIFCRKESQHFAVDVAFAFFFQFLTDMRSNDLDVVLQHIHVGENQVVDALQDVFDFAFFVCYFQRIVNVSVSEWFSGNYFLCELELIQDVE